MGMALVEAIRESLYGLEISEIEFHELCVCIRDLGFDGFDSALSSFE